MLANAKRALRGAEDFLCWTQSGNRFAAVEECHNGRKVEIRRPVKPKLKRPDARWGIAREGFDLLAECRETLGDSPDARECEKQFRFIADWGYDEDGRERVVRRRGTHLGPADETGAGRREKGGIGIIPA